MPVASNQRFKANQSKSSKASYLEFETLIILLDVNRSLSERELSKTAMLRSLYSKVIYLELSIQLSNVF